MTWVAVAVGGATIVAGGIQADASRRAANRQADAASQANQLTAEQYQQTRTDLMPWMNAGRSQLPWLQAGAQPGGWAVRPFTLQDFQASPSYQFNLDQGMQAINKAAAARGNYYAPQTLQDVAKFSQGLASNEYLNAYNMFNQNQANQWNREFALAGTGQNAAAQTGAFGANATNMMGQNLIGAGNAQAAGIVGQANAWTGAGSDIYNAWLTNQILRQTVASNQASLYGAPATGGGTYGFGGVGGAPY